MDRWCRCGPGMNRTVGPLVLLGVWSGWLAVPWAEKSDVILGLACEPDGTRLPLSW